MEDETESRQATLNRDADGDPLGIAIFLSEEQLQRLDVATDKVLTVNYRVVDGNLELEPETRLESTSD